MKQPRVIFLDAVGTLFGIRGSVGEIYSAIAARFGVTASSEILDQAFIQSFKSADVMAFPDAKSEEILQKEFQWWEAIAHSTFTQAGVYEQFTDFSAFFTQLYDHFATAAPWYLYSDVLPALESWRSKGIELAIISNFDSRLYQVLDALGLSEFFSSVTLSSEVGAAKPNPQIFQTALAKHHCSPEQAWHIGDSIEHDYQGAKATGMQAFLIQR